MRKHNEQRDYIKSDVGNIDSYGSLCKYPVRMCSAET